MQRMSKEPQLISTEIETTELLCREKRSCDSKKKQNDEDKTVKFRCDFPSTPVEVMLARGWTQVISFSTAEYVYSS